MDSRKIAVLVVAALAVALTETAYPMSAASRVDRSDFNGDGYADLAIGVPCDDAGGSVNVLYGTPTGLSEVGDQLFTRDTPGVEGSRGDRFFGSALASADFDRDGYADLAIGYPISDGQRFDGGVNVLYGSPRGPTGDRDDLWTPARLNLRIGAIGDALTAGDFDGDGFADLVIVAEWEYDAHGGIGAILVLRGSAAGLTATGFRKLSQDTPGVPGERGGRFGQTVAVGDIDGDGYDDLAVGSISAGNAHSGAVRVLFGSRSGLTGLGSEIWSQDSAGVKDVSELRPTGGEDASELFGYALAIGDFDDDGRDDLAVGVPEEVTTGGGAVNVLYGSRSGLTADGDQFWHQDVPGIAGVSRFPDQFGYALAAGDLDGDGVDDLAIGVPGESLTHSGAVHTLYGGMNGLSARGSQMWSQDTPGVPGVRERDDFFGSTLAIGDFGVTRQDDLIVGIPNEDIGALEDAGGTLALYGRSTGLSSIGAQPWDRSTPGVKGDAQGFAALGSALAASTLGRGIRTSCFGP